MTSNPRISIYRDDFQPYIGTTASRTYPLFSGTDEVRFNAGQAVRSFLATAIEEGYVTEPGVYFATITYADASVGLWRFEVAPVEQKLRIL